MKHPIHKVHAVDGDWPAPTKLPLIPGHEGAGVVAAVGPGVTAVKVRRPTTTEKKQQYLTRSSDNPLLLDNSFSPCLTVICIQVGDRVGIPWLHSSCGTCEFCLSGHETLCTSQDNTGYSVDGCFAQYTVSGHFHNKLAQCYSIGMHVSFS